MQNITHVTVPVKVIQDAVDYLTKKPLPFEETFNIIMALKQAADSSLAEQMEKFNNGKD